MKTKILICLILLSCCKVKQPPQSTVETTTINKINRINRTDSIAFDLYARVPDVTFKLIPNTDTFEVIQTIKKEQPAKPVNQIIVKAGKKSDINIQSPEQEAPDKIKAKGRSIINTGEGQVQKAPDKIKTVTKSSSNSGLVWISIVGVIVLGVLAYFLLRKRIS